MDRQRLCSCVHADCVRLWVEVRDQCDAAADCAPAFRRSAVSARFGSIIRGRQGRHFTGGAHTSLQTSRMKLTRRVAFSSGHRYWLSTLSEEGNRALFGPWSSPFNHGHNYVLEVTVSGRVDERHGMVVNIKDIDEVLKDRVVSHFDQKSLNDEVPEFFDRSTSSEVIAQT